VTGLAAAVDSATGPLDRLTARHALTEAATHLMRAAVAEARAGSVSWSTVGARHGVSKQAAAKRFSEKPRNPAVDGEEQPAEPPLPSGWLVATRRGRTLLRVQKAR